MALGSTPICAADLRVYCPSALREPMMEAARSYARTTSHRLEFVFASLGSIQKRVAMGERADVVIGSAEGVEALVKLGMARAESHVRIAETMLAFAARSRAGLPEVGDTEALRRTLESATPFGVPDVNRGAPGATQANELLQALKLSSDAHARMRRFGSGSEAVKLLQSERIDLALLWMSDVVGVPGIALSAPIVVVPTQGASYSAAVPRSAIQPDLGAGFIAHLRSAEIAKSLTRAGYRAAE
jgi:molybdate transport system substrate-binding protein